MKMIIAVFLLSVTSCSGGGGSASVAAGSGALVSDNKSSLTVPTGGFSEHVDVHVTEDAIGLSDIGNVTPLSSPITLEFNNVQPITGNDPMQLVIQLDSDAVKKARDEGKGIYAKIRMEGAQLASDGAHDGNNTWAPVLGSFDPNASTLTVPLLGGGEKIHVVVVAGDELKVVAIVPPDVSINASKSGSRKSKAVNTVAMGSCPWAIICNNPSFADGGAQTCNANDLNSPVMIMLSRLFENSNNLARLGFDTMKVQQLRGREIIHSGVPQVPTADVMQRHNPETMYNVAYLSDASPCSATASCYQVGLGQLYIRSSHIGNADVTKVSDDVVMHEMTHAVQAALCAGCFPADAHFAPFTEGTATVMGLWPVVGGNPSALAGRPVYNRERPWQEPIAKSTQANQYDLAYQMAQFYSLIDDGKVTKFPTLFRSFGGGGSLLRNLDQALTAATGKGLVHHYIRVMALRNHDTLNQGNYITRFPIWENVTGNVKTFSTKHYFGRAPWADADHPGCYNIVRIKSGRHPDLYIAVVGEQVDFSRRDGGTATVIDLGNGSSAIYSNDGARLHTNGAGDLSCNKDFFVINANMDGTVQDKMDYEFELGFD
jgi:hypothetical protein